MRLWTLGAVAAVAGVIVVTSVWDGGAPAPAPRVPEPDYADVERRAPLFGIAEPNAWRTVPPLATPDQIARLVASTGAQSQRFVIDWSVVEPEPPDGEHDYRFEEFDAMYRAAVHNGLRPLVVVLSAPAWAADPLTRPGGGSHNPPAPGRLGDWQAFLGAVARRYPRAIGIEVWNEPNHPAFWAAGSAGIRPDPVRYAALLESSYRAIKAANPGLVVIGGALAPVYPTEGAIPATEFLRAVLDAGGAASMDALSIHPYPAGAGIPRTLAVIEGVRRVRDEFGASMPLWLTEIGVTTTGPYAASFAEQAGSLVSVCRAVSRQPDVDAVYLHTLIDRRGAVTSPEPGYGLTRIGLNGTHPPKPALAAVSQVYSRPTGCAPSG